MVFVVGFVVVIISRKDAKERKGAVGVALDKYLVDCSNIKIVDRR